MKPWKETNMRIVEKRTQIVVECSPNCEGNSGVGIRGLIEIQNEEYQKSSPKR